MYAAARLASLRLAALAGLAASAALTHDTLHPERAFCPLEQACDRARGSALGQILGVPTALVGVLAFGGFLLVTLLPLRTAWRLSRWAGAAAAAAGLSFLAYQHFVLGTYCPFCLVADGAGLLAGIFALTWPAPPILRSGKPLPREPGGPQLAWLSLGLLAVAAPLFWPRSEEPAWVEIEPAAEVAEEDPVPTDPAGGTVGAARPTPGGPGGEATADAAPALPPAAAPPSPESQEPPSPAAPTPSAASTPPHRPTDAPDPLPARHASPRRSQPAESPVVIVEYLNAYCAHCRATHRRLEKVVAEGSHPARRRRVLTWASGGYPAWARAVAYAETHGLGERMFEELMAARGENLPEIYAAARRAGLDEAGLAAALRDPTPPPRLVRDRQLALSAGLRGLPTLDIGRRRLMGEQSEAELREALRAAAHVRPSTSARR